MLPSYLIAVALTSALAITLGVALATKFWISGNTLGRAIAAKMAADVVVVLLVATGSTMRTFNPDNYGVGYTIVLSLACLLVVFLPSINLAFVIGRIEDGDAN